MSASSSAPGRGLLASRYRGLSDEQLISLAFQAHDLEGHALQPLAEEIGRRGLVVCTSLVSLEVLERLLAAERNEERRTEHVGAIQLTFGFALTWALMAVAKEFDGSKHFDPRHLDHWVYLVGAVLFHWAIFLLLWHLSRWARAAFARLRRQD